MTIRRHVCLGFRRTLLAAFVVALLIAALISQDKSSNTKQSLSAEVSENDITSFFLKFQKISKINFLRKLCIWNYKISSKLNQFFVSLNFDSFSEPNFSCVHNLIYLDYFFKNIPTREKKLEIPKKFTIFLFYSS